LRQPPHLGGFAGPLPAFERDEPAARHRLTLAVSLARASGG
jgi:hypothetical protein